MNVGKHRSLIQLSIIIPVYNVQDYIERCVKSIVEQSYTDYEILLVNDGSTDRSGVICEQLAQIYSQVQVFHKSNGGQSTARNKGLIEAQGEYIWFVDADDYIIPDILESMMSFLLRNRAEALLFSYSIDDGKNISPSAFCREFSQPLTGKEVYRQQLCSDSVYCMISTRSAWVDNKLFFVEGIQFEDMEMLPRVLFHLNRIVYWQKAPYVYYLRADSTTKQQDLSKKYRQLDYFFRVEESWKQNFNLINPSRDSFDMLVIKIGTNRLHRGLLNFIRGANFTLKEKCRLYLSYRSRGVFSWFYNSHWRYAEGSSLGATIYWNTIGRSAILFCIFTLCKEGLVRLFQRKKR